jgi:hypothetical protein
MMILGFFPPEDVPQFVTSLPLLKNSLQAHGMPNNAFGAE